MGGAGCPWEGFALPDPPTKGRKAFGNQEKAGVREGGGLRIPCRARAQPPSLTPAFNPAVQGPVGPWWGGVRGGAKPLLGQPA